MTIVHDLQNKNFRGGLLVGVVEKWWMTIVVVDVKFCVKWFWVYS